jgi:transposase InsO family protein
MSRETSRGTATVCLLCDAFGVSRQAYYAALKPKATTPRKRRRSSLRSPWASTAEVAAGARAIVAEHPAWGVRKVWATLRRRGLIASRKRVWAIMRSEGLVLPPPFERDPAAPRGQVVTAESNRRWATDLTTVWTKDDGLVAVVPVVDCGDRTLLDFEVTKDQDSPCVLAPVERSLEAVFGTARAVPEGLELRTDHGPQYTGADCEALVKRWHVDHTLAPVGRPTGNAVAERLIQTLKIELLWTRDWLSAREVREAIRDWRQVYNHLRPHQALDWQTPAERRKKNFAAVRTAAA